ncbi:MAG: hypothetical protein WCH44_05995 [Betaproteobacteria bacterium]
MPLVALALAAPAQPSAPEPAAAAPPASAMDGALMYQLLLAELKLNQEEPATAYSLMLDAARRTDDERLYHRAVDIALQSHAGDAALAAARAWKDAQPASQDANGYLLQILIGMNRIRDTLEPLKFELASIPEAERAQSLGAVARQFARAGYRLAGAGGNGPRAHR